MDETRRDFRVVKVGGFGHVDPVLIGASYPTVIQTMWKDRLLPEDLSGASGAAIVERIRKLAVAPSSVSPCRISRPPTRSASWPDAFPCRWLPTYTSTIA